MENRYKTNNGQNDMFFDKSELMIGNIMNNKKALVVIDLQNDYLWNKRKKIFSYNTERLIKSVNNAVSFYKEKGYDVIYIAQIYPNTIINRRFIGFSINGTEGAQLYSRLNVVSDLCFEKLLPDAYSSKSFFEYMENQNYTEVILCGVDECACVRATAKSAVKKGINVFILENCIASRFSIEKVHKVRNRLKSAGVHYIK